LEWLHQQYWSEYENWKKKGIIDGYEVQLNPERFKKSLISYIIIRLQNYRDQDTAGKSLAEIEDIQEVHFVSGEDSFLVVWVCGFSVVGVQCISVPVVSYSALSDGFYSVEYLKKTLSQ